MKVAQNPEDRFIKTIMQDPGSGCWLWEGHINKYTGYGKFHIASHANGKCHEAHRASYILFKGKIPPGFVVMHSCDVKHCVNPAHLSVGTPKQNTHDMMAKGRQARGEKKSNTHLKNADVLAIRNDARFHHVIAADYGIARVTVTNIKSGKRWAHIGGPQSG